MKKYVMYGVLSALFLVFSVGSARADISLNDIISKVKSFPVPGGEVVRQLSPPGVQPRVYLIAMPNVRQHQTDYRSITFNPGDLVKVEAGGCVNPGVTISFPPIPPSRRYVDPIDKNGNALNGLYGLINIPGVTKGLQPIKNYNNKTFRVTASGYLSLGYFDSNYNDNIYAPLDPGERAQCSLAPLPAYVALTITPGGSASIDTATNANKATGSGSNQTTGNSSSYPPANSYTTVCAAKIPVEIQIDQAWLRKSISASASPANANVVDVLIKGSYKGNDGTVSCHYKSANGDIYNLVYSFPCKNAVLKVGSSWYCQK